MKPEPTTLADGLVEEMSRCRELVSQYKALGPVGAFGACLIADAMDRTSRAMLEGDTAQMVRCYQLLKGLQ